MGQPTRINTIRNRLGWSQSTLADHLGVAQSTVARLEGGQPETGPMSRLLDQLEADLEKREAGQIFEGSANVDTSA